MAVGDGRYRAEVPAADQRLMEQVGVGPSDWFVNSHDAMPVYSDTLVAAIKALESDPVAPAEESSSPLEQFEHASNGQSPDNASGSPPQTSEPAT